jgi:ribosomal protein S18 acetylase RimI-like enzyme
MPDLDVRPLRPEEFRDAASVLARGMCDTPNHIRAFGPDPGRRMRILERFLRPALPLVRSKGEVLGAFRRGELAGVLGMVEPGRCRPTLAESLRMMPHLLLAIPPGALLRMSRWMGEWARRDPGEPHWHLGPVGVDRPLQGQGIGTALMDAFCARMDALGRDGLAYLETETTRNVQFYRRFGFETVAGADVLGVANWFMTRPPRVV